MLTGLYPITLLTASLMALLIITMSYRCAMRRLNKKIEIGTGEDATMERLMRAQANLTEYTPITIILIGLLEANNVNQTLLMGLAGVFIVSRLMHAYGFVTTPGKNPGRFYGITLNWLVIIISSLIGLKIVLGF